MAAAYAAVMSLMRTSEMILHPYQPWLRINRNMIGSLLQKVRLLQEFLEEYSHRGHEEMAGLESQIADMAYAAEDVIESHVLDQILARSTGSEAKSTTSFSEYVQKLIEGMEDLIENKLMRIKETVGKFEEDPTSVDFSPAVSSRLAPNDQNTLVGSDEKLNEILGVLTGQQSNRQIVAIVGMGGIGKTTLAKNVYEHPLIKHHFDICVWATISQNYSARKIISEMLSEIEQSKSESLLSDEQLGEQLYKSLYGRTYLIVLDDFWSIEAWDEIKRYFPDHCNNGSRMMITTRLGNVAAHLSSCRPFEMELLDADRSWELLREKVFGHRGCPPELEELGKTIAKNTQGLPLAIVVIGGHLAKSDKTTLSWKHVAENLNSVINSEDNEKCLKILSLSYNNLPIHLKPCFLYFAMARKDHIPSLIKVWVSEGFVKPIRGKTLEEAANEYITDLIDRNLIFVRRLGIFGVVYNLSPGMEWPLFSLHNLVHLQKLESLNFIWLQLSPISSKYLSFPLSLKKLTLFGCSFPWEDMTIVGSLPNLESLYLRFDSYKGQTWCPIQGQFVKLKVLDIWQIDLVHWRADKTHFPILEHLNLQYMSKLKEFPEDFGEHPTLVELQVFYCSDSINAWAEQIREEQESFGNEGFRVRIATENNTPRDLFEFWKSLQSSQSS